MAVENYTCQTLSTATAPKYNNEWIECVIEAALSRSIIRDINFALLQLHPNLLSWSGTNSECIIAPLDLANCYARE